MSSTMFPSGSWMKKRSAPGMGTVSWMAMPWVRRYSQAARASSTWRSKGGGGPGARRGGGGGQACWQLGELPGDRLTGPVGLVTVHVCSPVSSPRGVSSRAAADAAAPVRYGGVVRVGSGPHVEPGLSGFAIALGEVQFDV